MCDLRSTRHKSVWCPASDRWFGGGRSDGDVGTAERQRVRVKLQTHIPTTTVRPPPHSFDHKTHSPLQYYTEWAHGTTTTTSLTTSTPPSLRRCDAGQKRVRGYYVLSCPFGRRQRRLANASRTHETVYLICAFSFVCVRRPCVSVWMCAHKQMYIPK